VAESTIRSLETPPLLCTDTVSLPLTTLNVELAAVFGTENRGLRNPVRLLEDTSLGGFAGEAGLTRETWTDDSVFSRLYNEKKKTRSGHSVVNTRHNTQEKRYSEGSLEKRDQLGSVLTDWGCCVKLMRAIL